MMKTKRQEDLVNSFLSILGEDIRLLYQDIIKYLSELGYNPYKQRSYIVFKHELHNKQMAKMGKKIYKDHSPFFALRFSACKEYSQKFTDIVAIAVSNPDFREAQCIYNGCNYCRGEAASHVYTYTSPNGENRSHCGAVAFDIPDIKADDIIEIKSLIKEEHEYLLKHEAGIM
jgi:hypothetical protein